MSLSNSQARARSLLVKLLVFLATAESCWYTINGNINHEYSLARRLGFFLKEEYYAFLVTAGLAKYRYNPLTDEKDEVDILDKEWDDMMDAIKSYTDDDENNKIDYTKLFTYTHMKFDRAYAHKGLAQRQGKYRHNYHVIRIGKFDNEGWSHKKISAQLKDRVGNHQTPHLPGLYPKKRNFVNEARAMFTHVIASDFDFYESLSNTNLEPNDEEDDESETDDDKPLPKKPKLARYSAGSSSLGLVGGIDVGEAEIADFVSNLPPKQFEVMFAHMINRAQNESGDKDMITSKNTGNNKSQKYVRVPTNTTEQSFQQHSGWVEKALEANGGGKDPTAKITSAKRIAKKLIKKLRTEEGDQVLEELGILPQEHLKMGAVKIAAMFKAAGVRSRHRRRALLKHLRHFFGKHVFDSETKVQMLCDGHTKVESDVVWYERVKGEIKEQVYYSQKNIADELAAQLARELNHRHIVDPKRVIDIDVMAGGDHGKGAFVFGAKVLVYVSKEDNHDEVDEEASFIFEISVAEIICSKDSADVIAITIKKELTKGLRTIAKKDMTISVKAGDNSGDDKTIFCSYDPDSSTEDAVTRHASLYIVADLACHAMILGKEDMSGKWCFLCKMAASKMGNLDATADRWTMEDLVQFATDYEAKVEEWKQKPPRKRSKHGPQPELGVKEKPWWDFIPLEHYIVPLLHCNIGIGDIILNKFRSFVSEKIEYLSPEEASTRAAKGSIEETIVALQAERDAFNQSPDGKELRRLKGMLYRTKKALPLCEDVSNNLDHASKQKATSLLDEVLAFVEEGVKEEDGIAGELDLEDIAVPAAAAAAEAEPPIAEPGAVAAAVPEIDAATTEPSIAEPPAAPGGDATTTTEPPIAEQPVANPGGDAAAAQVQALKNKKIECEEKIKPLEQKLKEITNKISKAKKYKTSLNDKIKEFAQTRKRSGDGIESEMFPVLKSYGIEVQAYHGGSLHGKDVQKLMNNASDIFASFATILKDHKKDGCEFNDTSIESECKRYAQLCVLWDGAFSYASKINPTRDDINLYQRFVTAAVHLHVKLGMNVTPKVHLMWKHVAQQMELSGGLGQKREDWVEQQHQETSSVRNQYRNSMGDAERRGRSMARLMQQETNQDVVAHCNLVDADTSKGARKNFTSVEELRKEIRQKTRLSTLECWEKVNPDKKYQVVQVLLCREAMT